MFTAAYFERKIVPMPHTIKIFLASSAELKADREKFEQFIGRKNKTLNQNGCFIELVIWEDFIDAMSRKRLQGEYNKVVQTCDIFVMLFATKVGRYTREEFEAAFGQFQESGKPWIYTFFKTAAVKISQIPREDMLSLYDFQDRLNALGHFWKEYENSDDLINQFNRQFELLDPCSDGPPPPPPPEAIIHKYRQQLIQDTDFNSMPVIGKTERQRLENLYVRLKVTAQGDKTVVAERFRLREGDKEIGREMYFHDLAPDVAIKAFRRFAVLGGPGMGKTTLFRFIAYTVARLGLGLAQTEEFSLTGNSYPLPLYLPLTELKDQSGDLLGCLKDYLGRRFPGCQALAPLLDALLKDGRCLLLLDSLDEVKTSQLGRVKDSIKGFLNNADWQESLVLLSCREASWQRNEAGLVFPAVLQIAELDEAAIGGYLHRWYPPAESAAALNLKEKIVHTPRLKALATNPFLLSLIAWLAQRDRLPERRVELYLKCTGALLREEHKEAHERQTSAFGSDHAELKERILTDVAFAMMEQNLQEISRNRLREIIRTSLGIDDITDERPGKLIDEIHKGSAILRETNAERIYEFQHNTFREYFAARKLAAALARLLGAWQQAGSKIPLAEFIEKQSGDLNPLNWIGDPLWTETNRLAVGLLDQPTPVLEMLFTADPTLAARCYLDANPDEVDHEVIRELWTERIDREERVKLVRSIRENLSEEREVLDFIAGIFLTGETDSEVLYYCDALLQAIDTEEAAQLSHNMFEHWPKERQFRTHQQVFEKDPFWQFAEIETGTFQMGSNDYDSEKPIHPVKLSPFQMGCYPVTVEQYQRFDPEYRQRWEKNYGQFLKDENQPVIRVDWFDAYVFSKWAGGRLPTEAQWEYACRAGTTTPFYTGDNLTTDQANYNGNYPYGDFPKGKYLAKTTPVGSYPPNPWGLYDMHGNVWEWCRDWFGEGYYAKCQKEGTVQDPPGPENGSYRVLRGGSWSNDAQNCRSAFRFSGRPAGRDHGIGFRLVFVP